MTESRSTALYRYFDKDDSLLYVGIAYDPDERQKGHAVTAAKTWYPLAAKRTVAWFHTRTEAERAEKAAIKNETPRFNDRHNQRRDPIAIEADRERFERRAIIGATGARALPLHYAVAEHLRNQINAGVLEPGAPVPKRSELVEKFGISDASVKSAFVDLVHEGYIKEFRAKGYFVLPPEDRRISIRVGHPEEAADALRAALTDEQVALLIAALQTPSAEAA